MKEMAIACSFVTEDVAFQVLEEYKGCNYLESTKKKDFTDKKIQKEIQSYFEPLGATLSFKEQEVVLIIEKKAFFRYLEIRKKALKKMWKEAFDRLENSIKAQENMRHIFEPFSYMLYTLNTKFHDCLILGTDSALPDPDVLSLEDYVLYNFAINKDATELSLHLYSIFEIN